MGEKNITPFSGRTAFIASVLENCPGAIHVLADDESAARKLNQQLHEEKKRTEDNKNAIKRLLTVAKDEKKSQQERRTAIEQLKKIMPDYFKNLNTETAKQYKLADALQAVNKQYKEKIKNAYLDAKKNYEKAKSDYDKMHPNNGGMNAIVPGATAYTGAYQGELLQQRRRQTSVLWLWNLHRLWLLRLWQPSMLILLQLRCHTWDIFSRLSLLPPLQMRKKLPMTIWNRMRTENTI